ncbi:MAG: hypothetical protein M0009_02550 [Deltaproteobacteria bacterium]|nr:hypothetical protein [Deltaproteobacteria bacterium]
MRFQGALIKEQGVTFAVVIVKKPFVDNRIEANKAIKSFQPIFPGIPIVLMAQDHRGTPEYYGRQDLSRFLANVPVSAIPWKEYTVN